ncbi:sensor histidine kinase [Massilia sp. TN1-12]|uniref:sensor histidine kinase n=1 Tax=Massilia paldalensis TaxID=3377675 RepID=UPI00384F7092
MSLASDQDAGEHRLSENARRMLALRERVFDTWSRRVRAQVLQARALQQPILIDTLPVFYDNIAQSISPAYPRTSAIDGTTVAAEHGGERARITTYDHAALIEEYQLLRWAIFDVLHREGVALDHVETHAVHSSIDSGIQQAVEAFSLVHSGFRERFAAALTHDLRNPLAATVTALEVILLTDDPTRIKTVAAKALANTQRMSGMIDELLDTMAFHGGRKIQLAIEPVDVHAVVQEVLADAIAAHGHRFEVEGEPVQGWWDRAAMKRVTENLVTNAVKYGSAGTPITIRTSDIYGRLVLTVHNEGEPIPAQEQECIFQMYRRAESAKRDAKGGWGIGLPYVRAVAESHGGSIGLDSSAERGTTFVVDIPLDARPHQNADSLAQEQV